MGDLRQLLWHWLVRLRTRIPNQLQALAMTEGRCRPWPQGTAKRSVASIATWPPLSRTVPCPSTSLR